MHMQNNLQKLNIKLNEVTFKLDILNLEPEGIIYDPKRWELLNQFHTLRKKYLKKQENLQKRIDTHIDCDIKKEAKIKPLTPVISDWFHIHPHIQTEDYLIVAGRNAQSSEKLRKRFVSTDYYLHAFGIKGGSILLRVNNTKLLSEAVFYAKSLALLYSSLWTKYDALSGPVIITTGDLIVKYKFKSGVYFLKKYKLETGEIDFEIFYDKETKSVNFFKGFKLGKLIRNDKELAPIVKKLILDKYSDSIDLNYLITILPITGNIV